MAQNVLIIGASRGIGLEFANQFVARNVNLYITCRKINQNLQDFAAAHPNVQILENIEVGNDTVMDAIKDSSVLPSKIDIAVFNSGIYVDDDYKTWKSQSLIDQFNVNSLGPMRIFRALLESNRLQENSKYCVVSSRSGSIGDTGTRLYGYRMSKCAVNIAMRTLANEVKDQKIAIGILHPGYVNTDMTGHKAFIDPDESVSGMMKLIDNLNLENSGTFWHTNGSVLPW